MLKTRVITALALLAFFIPLFIYSTPNFLSLVLAILITLGAWEWGRFLWGVDSKKPLFYAISLLALTLLLLIISNTENLNGVYTKLMLIVLSISVFFWVFIAPIILNKKLEYSINQNRLFLGIFGFIIFLSSWYALLVLRNKGLLLLITVLMIVWAADIGAYFFGKTFGRRKLAPQISPGKSIEGACGGILTVFLISICFYIYNQSANDFFSMIADKYSVIGLILISLFLAIMSIFGDLFESQLKRLSGMKDSSNLLPGHGGILDRLDALLPVLPISAMIVLELF